MGLESGLSAICRDVHSLHVWPSLPVRAQPTQSSSHSRRVAGDTNSVTGSAQLAHDDSAVGVRGNSSAVETETITSVRSADRSSRKVNSNSNNGATLVLIGHRLAHHQWPPSIGLLHWRLHQLMKMVSHSLL